MDVFESTLNEQDMQALARALARGLHAGDCLALSGPLGAGKSTFARVVITALSGVSDVPSPTYTLAQHYDGRTGSITHFDFYRIKHADEIFELGFEDALSGITLIEWPQKAETLLPKKTCRITLALVEGGSKRHVRIENATQAMHMALSQFHAEQGFLNTHSFAGAVQKPLLADFSARRYTHLARDDKQAMLMAMPKAEDLKPFLAMQLLLKQQGCRVPEVYASDAAHGIALLEYLGDTRLDTAIEEGQGEENLMHLAVDVLLHLHKNAKNVDVEKYGIPLFDAARFTAQASLFLDVYGPLVMGRAFTEDSKKAFTSTWLGALEVACAGPQSILLRDYHAANIMILEDGAGIARAGLIDFQDGGVGPVAYDLASLLEDARRDVPEAIKKSLITYYLAQSGADKAAFMQSYHVLAAQRHIRVLAIVARRWLKDGKAEARDYFKRTWRLLLQHKEEALLKNVFVWLDANVPEKYREGFMP